MNRYNGSTGAYERVPEPDTFIIDPPGTGFDAVNEETERTPGQSGIFGGLGGLLSKFTKPNLELEDMILVAVLYLLYRESKDVEFLLIAGAMLFL